MFSVWPFCELTVIERRKNTEENKFFNRVINLY